MLYMYLTLPIFSAKTFCNMISAKHHWEKDEYSKSVWIILQEFLGFSTVLVESL